MALHGPSHFPTDIIEDGGGRRCRRGRGWATDPVHRHRRAASARGSRRHDPPAHIDERGVHSRRAGDRFRSSASTFPSRRWSSAPYKVSVLVFTVRERVRDGRVEDDGCARCDDDDHVLTDWSGRADRKRRSGRVTLRCETQPGEDRTRLSARVQIDQPIRAVSIVVRGIPRGQVSGGGTPFSNPARWRAPRSATRSRAAISSATSSTAGSRRRSS